MEFMEDQDYTLSVINYLHTLLLNKRRHIDELQ